MQELSVTSRFVAPHYIEELGEEGLTLHEVARSLGIEFKEAKRVYEKNISDYSGVEISTEQQIQEVTGHSYVRTVKSYAITTEDAQFFVSGYGNDIGKSYRRYLIRFEKKAMQLLNHNIPSKPERALAVIKAVSAISDLYNVPHHYALIEAAKYVEADVGLDMQVFLQHSPLLDNIKDEEVVSEPTELAEALGYPTAQAMNSALKGAGLQVKENGVWVPTDLGKAYCIRHAWKKGTKSGYNLKWKVEKIRALLNEDSDSDE